jgi:hypothetical protein
MRCSSFLRSTYLLFTRPSRGAGAGPGLLCHRRSHSGHPTHLRPILATRTRSLPLSNPSALLSTRTCRSPAPPTQAPPTHFTRPAESESASSSLRSPPRQLLRLPAHCHCHCQPSLGASFRTRPRALTENPCPRSSAKASASAAATSATAK